MSRPKKEQPAPLNLWQKILKISSEVGSLVKTGYNEKGGYQYITHVQAMEALVPLQAKYGVIVEPPDAVDFIAPSLGEKDLPVTRIKFQFVIRNAENPTETITKHVWGEATDYEDKGAAKAATLADKYLCLKLFRIATPELDPDASSQERTPQTGHSKRKAKKFEGFINGHEVSASCTELNIGGNSFIVTSAELDCILAPAMEAGQHVSIEAVEDNGPKGKFLRIVRILEINGKDFTKPEDLTGPLEASIENAKARKNKANGIKIVSTEEGVTN
jgi:hypothetical protein